jgi:hypothetical protein
MKKYLLYTIYFFVLIDVCNAQITKSKLAQSKSSIKSLAKDTPATQKNGNIFDNRNEPQTNAKEDGFFSTKHFSFWTLLPLLLCLGIVVMFLRMTFRLNERIDRRKEEIKALSGTNSINQYDKLPLNSRDVEKMVMSTNLFQSISKDIAVLKHQMKNIKPNKSTNTQPSQQPAKQEALASEIFYMAGPVNNYFPNTAKSPTKENTVYKFKLKDNKQEATYEIHTLGAPVNEILSMAESYIKPACDEENLPTLGVRNIITKKLGTASLDGDKWIIKTKAIIKYE